MPEAHGQEPERDAIAMPAPTSWPLLAAAGVCMGMGGLVTHPIVSMVGGVLFLSGAVGWFRDVLPHERHEWVPLEPPARRARPVALATRKVEHLRVGVATHRMRIPVEVHPYSAGIKGAAFGAVAMAALAVLFGVVSHGSPWYPINLLAAAVLPSLASADTATLASFDPTALALATVVHVIVSLIVGLLYGLLLPMLPHWPLLVGGLIGPLLWTGLVWASLGVINPVLNARIEWGWFIASQIAFGVVAGLVVARTEKIRTVQSMPFTERAGIEHGAVDEEGR
jgi:hypothetical protein